MSTFRAVRPVGILAVVAVLATGSGACGDDGGSGSSGSSGGAYGGGSASQGGGSDSAGSAGSGADATSGGDDSTSGGEGAVSIADFKFDPEALTVEAGTEVVWTNEDSADHTATAEDGSFDTGTFGKGEEGSAVMDDPGTFAYICDLHPFMKAEIVVE